ncbi:MAG: DUF1501 domain-containing protein [Planctomycetaceae bacterium]|nr:DUF1501 domain-containing protein [Planctomycetaceae bacterium]
MLSQAANGFGAVALASLLNEPAYGAAKVSKKSVDALAPKKTHHQARAKSVIFLYMDGGPSQVDTYDPKPRLIKENGQPIKAKLQATQFDNIGKVLQSPWKFQQYGESGIPVSDLFPYTAKCVDDMSIIRSMTATFPEHTNANYFLHTGHGLQGRPSMGAWTGYGLGSECRDLPGFVVLNGGLIPPGGIDCFHNGFLPASYQGSIFKKGAEPVADLKRQEQSVELQNRKMDLLRGLDQQVIQNTGAHDAIEASISNYELAYRMQTSVPNLMDISQESKQTQELYGMFSKFPQTQTYAHQCLVARRLVERGVRFIELTCPSIKGDRWDQHSNLKDGHEQNALAVDQPIGGLLTDLKSRGLLDETLVIWAGEFGRTPMAQGTNGRDHNPSGFTVWMAGGGIKGGTIYGATDEYGYNAIENKLQIHDMHATMLHLLGIDHERLTFRHSSRDMRLTDVHGKVVHDIIS